MEQFDELLKAMAKKEEIIVPNGFDGRMQDALDNLPARVKKAGLGAVKTVLIAAAACVLLVGTAFAASPTLRGMLAEALGGFAPYAQEQGGEPYVINGIEFRVKSVLADDFTVRAYVEARDLEGDDLFRDMEPNTPGTVYGMIDVPRKESVGVGSAVCGGTCLGYDEAAGTARLSFTTWGQDMADDPTGAKLYVRMLDNWGMSATMGTEHQAWSNSESVGIPVEVTPVESRVLAADTAAASGLRAEEVRLSPLGLSAVFEGEQWKPYTEIRIQVCLADGTLVDALWEGGQGSFGQYGTDSSRKVLVWNFRQPVDADNIQGVYVGEDYFPIW